MSTPAQAEAQTAFRQLQFEAGMFLIDLEAARTDRERQRAEGNLKALRRRAFELVQTHDLPAEWLNAFNLPVDAAS